MAKERILLLDVLKGLTMFLVIWGHCIQYGTEFRLEESFYNNALFQLIYSFHMPLFMLVSGYLFYSSTQKRSISENAKSKLKYVAVPALAGGIFYFCIDVVQHFDQLSVTTFFERLLRYAFLNIWFLWAVVICSMVVLLNQKMTHDKFWVYMVLMVLSLGLHNHYNMAFYVYMFPYFLAGYYWHKKSMSAKVAQFSTQRIVLCFCTLAVLFAAALHFYSKSSFIYTSGTYVLQSEAPYVSMDMLWIDLHRYLTGFLGASSFILLVYILLKVKVITGAGRLTKILLYVGKNSLGLYVYSELFNLIMKNTQVWRLGSASYSYMLSVAEAVVVVGLTLFLVSLLSKSKFGREILLGKKTLKKDAVR